MKIRTQLMLAWLLLAIVPLAAIVLYSYRSSRSALESAYQHEAERTSRQMDRRLAAIRSDLEQKLAEVSALPLQQLPADPAAPADKNLVVNNVLSALGETAGLVDSLELQPLSKTRKEQPDEVEAPEAPDAPEEAEKDEDADAPEPIVIDIPDVPEVTAIVHNTMSQEQRTRLRELARLGQALERPGITDAERNATLAELQKTQRDFDAAMAKSQKDFAERVQKAVEAHTKTHRVTVVPAVPPTPVVAPKPAPQVQPETVVMRRQRTDAERQRIRDHQKKVALILGDRLNVPVRKEGTVVGHLTAQVKPAAVIQRVLGAAADDGEIAFAADKEGNVYTRNDDERQKLASLGVIKAFAAKQPLPKPENWVLGTSFDKASGLRVGVARPVAEDLQDLKRTAGFNFAAGIALVFVALIGIVPVANHLTRDVKLVTTGAERIAKGDLMTRLPVKSGNELGQLATAFNKMAEDLSRHEETIVSQERSRKEQELQNKLLELEYGRKSVELEEARRFQLSLLPKVVPDHRAFDVAVFTQTATEVGGDYYDFHHGDDGSLTITVGDATGHGAKAGTMVTVVKTLFASYAASLSPAAFLGDAAEKIKRMELGRMAMSLLLARFESGRMTLAAAGMPPALVHRGGTKNVDEIAIEGTPLGTLGSAYADRTIALAAGDTVLLMTDGFPELLDDEGRQLGYNAALDAFAIAAEAATANDVIASIAAAVRGWRGDQAPNDDVTFVVVRVR